MNNTNGISRRPLLPTGTPAADLPRCPACESPISQEEFDRILRITQARQRQQADERAALQQEREKLATERAAIATDAVAKERAKWEAASARAKQELERQREQFEAKEKKISAAYQKAMEAEQLRRQRQEKQLAQAVAAAQAKAKTEAQAQMRETKKALDAEQRAVVDDLRTQLKRRERDEETMKAKIAELQRKAEMRDRGHFGDEGEEDLIKVLTPQFPHDRFEHRGKRGDVLQVVFDGNVEAGRIIHEVKNRGKWEPEYVRQIKAAMESHGTRYGVLVSRTLPARSKGLCIVRGVIVCVPAIAPQIVSVVRDGMIEIARLRLSEDGKSEKVEALFEYLRGDEFQSAIQRVQEKIVELRESLLREKSFHEGFWTTRESHYASILRAAAGVHVRVRDLLGGAGPGRAKPLPKKIARGRSDAAE